MEALLSLTFIRIFKIKRPILITINAFLIVFGSLYYTLILLTPKIIKKLW